MKICPQSMLKVIVSNFSTCIINRYTGEKKRMKEKKYHHRHHHECRHSNRGTAVLFLSIFVAVLYHSNVDAFSFLCDGRGAQLSSPQQQHPRRHHSTVTMRYQPSGEEREKGLQEKELREKQVCVCEKRYEDTCIPLLRFILTLHAIH